MGMIFGAIMAWFIIAMIVAALGGVWMGICAVYYRCIAASELGDSSAGPLLQSIDELNRSLNKAEKALECTQKAIASAITKYTVAIDGAERHAVLLRAIADTYKAFRGEEYTGTSIDGHFDIDSFADRLVDLAAPRKATEEALTQYAASSAERVAKNSFGSSARAAVLDAVKQRIATSDRRISCTQYGIRSNMAIIKRHIGLLCS